MTPERFGRGAAPSRHGTGVAHDGVATSLAADLSTDSFTQEHRRLRIETPLGRDALLLTALTGTEAISTLFHYEAELLGRDERVDFDAIVGKGVTVSIAAGGGERYVHGVVGRFTQAGTVGRRASYRAEIVPWPWFLTRTTDCRIFQRQSVPDIVKHVFGELGFAAYRFALSASYEPREYCVQYRESTFNFIARLFEEEGIFYFFEHERGKHTLVVADDGRAHKACPVLDAARFTHEQVSLAEDDVVTWFSKEQEVRASRCTLKDYNFETPSIDLSAQAVGADSSTYELYDYPACAPKRDRTEALVRIRQQQEDAARVRFHGSAYLRSFTPGFKFSLKATGDDVSDAFDGSYVLTSVCHRASESHTSGGESDVSYDNTFECIDASVPFRPARRTPRPVMHGVQTAVVVGPDGEEIFVDRYGRVKVQFFWDREGKRDENSSCWLRVSTSWAGKNWGIVSIPRIGQEVVIAFLEGDPDQPIIVGSVYNGEQMPPYELPGSKTQSGIKSRSSLGGSPANFNEIRFEDKTGSEQIYVHAERDHGTIVEHDQTLFVGNDKLERVDRDKTIEITRAHTERIGTTMSLQVGADQTILVGSNLTEVVALNYAETVGAAMELTVGGALAISVGAVKTESVGAASIEQVAGGKTLTVGSDLKENVAKDRRVQVDGNITQNVGGQHKATVAKEFILNAKKIQLVAEEEISIKTGDASLILKKNGDVSVSGAKINLKGSGDVTIKGSKIKEN